MNSIFEANVVQLTLEEFSLHVCRFMLCLRGFTQIFYSMVRSFTASVFSTDIL